MRRGVFSEKQIYFSEQRGRADIINTGNYARERERECCLKEARARVVRGLNGRKKVNKEINKKKGRGSSE